MRRLLVCMAIAGCTHAQSSLARHVGEALSIGSVAGIVGSIAIDGTTSADLKPLTTMFEVTSGIGIVMYAIAELSQPEFQDREVESPAAAARRQHRWARTWSERARAAARLGDCERVRTIEPRILRLDPELHDLVLMQDADVLKCLQREREAPTSADTP